MRVNGELVETDGSFPVMDLPVIRSCHVLRFSFAV